MVVNALIQTTNQLMKLVNIAYARFTMGVSNCDLKLNHLYFIIS